MCAKWLGLPKVPLQLPFGTTAHDRSACEPTTSESPFSIESSTNPKEFKREVLVVLFVALVGHRPEGVSRGCLGHHDDATAHYVKTEIQMLPKFGNIGLDILLHRCWVPLTG